MIKCLATVTNKVTDINRLTPGSGPGKARMTSTAGGVGVAEAKAQVERVLAAECFRNSDSSRRLLRFLADESLANRARELKEYSVGMEVFGKPAEYDPRVDASTRVQAGKLRQRLDEFYRTEGVSDPIIIQFPKGGFQLSFDSREKGALPWLRIGLAASITVSLLLVAYILITAGRNKPNASPSDHAMQGAWTPEMEAFWSPIVDDPAPVVVSLGMPLFIAFANGGVVIRHHTLNDWPQAEHSQIVEKLKRFYGNSGAHPEYTYTGEGDATAAFLLARLLSARKRELLLKRSNVLAWEDMKNNHLLFLGNQKSQPQLRDILAERDFRIEPEGIRTLHANAGDPPFFPSVFTPGIGFEQEYALIRRLPGSPGRKEIFAFSSLSTEGVWALAEYVTDGRSIKELVQKLRGSSGQMPRAWEAIFRIRYKSGVPVQTQYVSHHVL
jgi:hypothetical protein